MRIQHNIASMNAYRNYNNNTRALSKNLEKLSSGYKINRAGDDAAGLAISEKMRAQITGLNAAQKNVKDGVSLVKTAEGAMQEIQDMLNRMDYLATQSANGTYDNEVDRANLQKEVDNLKTEINRIADSANFNGIKLLDGSLDETIKAQDKVTETVTIDPTKENALTFDNGKLAEVGSTLGVDTVLHNEANGDHGTEFSLDFHNFKFNAAKGNTLNIKMGDTEITLKATEDHGIVDGETGGISDALLGANGYEITVDGKTVDTLDGMQINGQTLNVSKSSDHTYRLTFQQDEAPADAASEINGAMKVTISGQVEPKKAEFTFKIADMKDAAGTAITPKAGDVITINGGSYVVKEKTPGTAEGWSDIIANMEKDGIVEGYKIETDGTTVTLKATEAGKKTTPTISYKQAVAKQQTTVTEKTTGADATKSKHTTGALTVGGTVTAGDKLSLTVNYKDAQGNDKSVTVEHTVAAGNDSAAVATSFKALLGANTEFNDLFTIGGDESGLTFEAKTAGANKQAVSGISVAANDGANTTIAAGTPPTGATDQVAGKDAVKDVQTIDVTGWNDSNLGVLKVKVNGADEELNYDTLTAAGERGVELGSTGYVATLDGNKLVLTAKNGGAVGGGTGPANKPTEANYFEYKAPVKLTETDRTITVVQEGAEGGEMQGITEGAHGDFNVSTTNIKNVAAGGADRLASTHFDLTADMVKDGSVLTIGTKEYEFTTDEKKINAGSAGNVTYVDARGDLLSTAKNLTEAAKGNDVWTVGHDATRITLTETAEHGNLKNNNDLTDYRDNNANFKFDLSTKAGIEKSLGFVGAGSYTKENVISEATEGGKALTLQIGDTSDEFNQMKVSVGDMHVSAMKLTDEETGESTSIADIDISTQDGAAKAVNVIKASINYVSSVRGDLGAIQNRLEHTQNNLSVMAENIQDAESTIRDTDVAEEMMSYVKNNILVQSAQAMLAQANQLPQGVLQLLG